jgi:hypothetical protein
MPKKSLLWMVTVGVALFGAGLFGAFQIAQQVYHEDYQDTAFVKWGSAPRPDSLWVVEKSQYDFLAFSPNAWDNESMQEAREELLKENLDIMLGSYIWAFNVPTWAITAAENGYEGFSTDFFRAAEPYWAVTTEGDTATIWKDNPIFDVFNPECRTAVIQSMNTYIRRNHIDWMMLDFISVPIPHLMYNENEIGDLDFDRDGIGHWVDLDEQQKLAEVWVDYIEEMRETFPQNFKIIPNGESAIKDPLFAKLVDGCYIEHFPEWFFGETSPNFNNAFDPEYPNSLWELSRSDRWYSSKYYVMIEDVYNRGTFGYIAKIFDNVVELKIQLNETTVPKMPIEIDTGKPIGPPVLLTNNQAIRRQFEKGTVQILKPFSKSISYEFSKIVVDTLGHPGQPIAKERNPKKE